MLEAPDDADKANQHMPTYFFVVGYQPVVVPLGQKYPCCRGTVEELSKIRANLATKRSMVHGWAQVATFSWAMGLALSDRITGYVLCNHKANKEAQ